MIDTKLPVDLMKAILDNETNSVTTPLIERAISELAEQETVCNRYRLALEEIRDAAGCSEGVEFYAMLSQKALDGEDDPSD